MAALTVFFIPLPMYFNCTHDSDEVNCKMFSDFELSAVIIIGVMICVSNVYA